jgi:hypothetical protein
VGKATRLRALRELRRGLSSRRSAQREGGSVPAAEIRVGTAELTGKIVSYNNALAKLS